MVLEEALQQPYQYRPLDNSRSEIRLLELLAGIGTANLCGKLTTHSLQEDLHYEALSYMWGSPLPTDSIALEDGHLNIASNLQLALRHLRYADRSRMLWIDAICIDQENLSERSQQVKLMQEIYQNAKSVVAWVDYGFEPTSKALEALQDLIDNDRFDETPETWEPVVGLFQNAYWNRVWVQQELMAASSAQIQCRQSSIPLEAIAAFQLQIQKRALNLDSGLPRNKWYMYFGACGIGKSPAKSLPESRPRYLLRCFKNIYPVEVQQEIENSYPNPPGANSRGTLLYSLNAFRFLNTTDPRDRVFALLGICADTTPFSIPINYREEHTLGLCFADAIDFIIGKYKTLEFLCQSRLPLDELLEPIHLPSWIPDWHSQKGHPEIFSDDNCASGNLKALHSPLSTCRSRLRVQGFRIDSVDHVDIVRDLTSVGVCAVLGHILALSLVANTRRQVKSDEELVLQNVAVPDQLLRTICHRFEGLVTAPEDIDEIRCGLFILHTFATRLKGAGGDDFPLFLIRDLEHFKSLSSSDRSFIFSLIWALTGKCFIVSGRGYAGLILASKAEPGDEIWIPFGCSMPVLVRRVEDHYIFVTPVSIDGFMKGEAVQGISGDIQDGDRHGEYEVQSIELR